MKQKILTFKDLDDASLLSSDLHVPSNGKKLRTVCSTISPGTELSCIRGAAKSGNPTQPGYILTGEDEAGRRYFMFPSLGESSGCHCDVRSVGPESLLLPLPSEISPEDAGFLRFINIGMHSFNRLDKLPEAVCVIGLGPVGNLAAQTARLFGCKVVGVDHSSKRRKIANGCGIGTTVAPEQLADYEKSFEFVIDTVAGSSSLASSAAILKDGGECSMVGIIKDGDLKATENFREVWLRNLVFRSGWEMLSPLKKQAGDMRVSTEENLLRAMNWMKSGLYSIKPLLTGVIPAEIGEIKTAYRRLNDNPDDNMCYVIKWQ